uniref:Ribonuclease A-domain domain-containing protein n=1 Tax=Naja naja TaxID=35670 RepID=A0A8C6XDA7_NAJNA
ADSWRQSWAAFKNKHIDSKSQYPPHNMNLYCENQMRNRRMTRPLCKPHNTFIYAPESIVQQICQNIRGPAAITSRVSFNLVDCRYTGGSPPNSCNYQGSMWTKYIAVTCVNYVPVHFIRFV